MTQAQMGTILNEVERSTYKPLKLLEEGGFSNVLLVRKKRGFSVFWKPKSLEERKTYAAKVLILSGGDDCAKIGSVKLGYVPRTHHVKAQNELYFLKRAQNPDFVVQLVDSFMLELKGSQQMWIIMEYVTGNMGNIDDALLLKTLTVNSEDLGCLAAGMLLCLKHLQSLNIVHKDIKSMNFLVSSEGQVKVCDFGFARAIDPEVGYLEVPDGWEGTEQTVAPEMYHGERYDFSVDVYAVGVVIFTMIEPNHRYFVRGPSDLEFCLPGFYDVSDSFYIYHCFTPSAIDYDKMEAPKGSRGAVTDAIRKKSKEFRPAFDFVTSTVVPLGQTERASEHDNLGKSKLRRHSLDELLETSFVKPWITDTESRLKHTMEIFKKIGH